MFSFLKKKEKVIENTKIIYQENYNDIEPISKYFHNETGITFDKQISILKSKVTSFCKQRYIYSFSKLLEDIKVNQTLKQELIDSLTTNETFFYREFKQIKELVELVKKTNREINILCAPSSTGEEPYSIAIALLESAISASSFNIVGIDINSDAILKAQKAIYGERNIRNLSDEIISNYFTKDNNKYILNQNIKSLVRFKIANLFDNSFKDIGKFDFVFSRNMLIYFDKETKLKAKSILESMRKNDNHKVFFGHADLF
ncbi:MAG: protein-glutamate O-methyltransferase CheR [Sulfurimonas sp.]|nr:protein-glutamate O-methyltransferase CheR [Sulfurimonas sp.]